MSVSLETPFKLSSEQQSFSDTVEAFSAEHFETSILRKKLTQPQSSADKDVFLQLGLFDGFLGKDKVFGSVELSILAKNFGRWLVPERILEQIICCEFTGDTDCNSGIGNLAVNGYALQTSSATRYLNYQANLDSNQSNAVISYAEVSGPDSASADLFLNLQLVKSVTSDLKYSSDQLRDFQSGLFIIRASEMLGVLSRILEITVPYLKTREQFSVPIGGFQAVQQKIADVSAKEQSLAALTKFAAWSREFDPQQAARSCCSAALYATKVVVPAIEVLLQVSGGIGFTWDYDLHLYLRRALVLRKIMPAVSFHDLV